MYVTVEPCLMCAGALVHARVGLLVFGTTEPKAGAVVSTLRALEHGALNHRVEVEAGVLEGECRAVVREFFQRRCREREGRAAPVAGDDVSLGVLGDEG